MVAHAKGAVPVRSAPVLEREDPSMLIAAFDKESSRCPATARTLETPGLCQHV